MSVRPHEKQQTDPRYRDAWLIDYYDRHGVRHKYKYHGTEAAAWELERSWRIQSRRTPVAVCPALNEAAPLYLEHYCLDHLPSGTERLQRSVKIVLRLLGRYHFHALTTAVIEEYKRQRLTEGVKPTTINKELAALSGFCRWANEQGWCERIHIKRFPAKLSRAPIPQVPSRKEVIRFLRALPRAKRGLWAAMYYCGLRASEARSLTARHINWSLGVMIVTGKGNKQRVIPLNRKILPYLRRKLPFYGARDLRGVAYWAVKRSGLQLHIHPHLLRHAFGVHMTERGVSLRALQDIMGHSSSQVTEIYSRLAAEALSREMDKF